MKTYLLLSLLLFPLLIFGQKTIKSPYADLKRERIDSIKMLLNFKPNEVIADIGSGDGSNLIRILGANQSLSIYAEDIDSSKCNRSEFQKKLKLYKSNLSIDSFHFVYGNEISSLLPSRYFDKIFLIAVVHEFNYRNQMLENIKAILKEHGEIFIEEPLVKHHVPKERGCNNPYLTESELLQILSDNAIHIKKQVSIKGNKNSHNYFRKAYLCTLD